MKDPFQLWQGIMALALFTELVVTPEQREQWSRNYDWEYYASKYTD